VPIRNQTKPLRKRKKQKHHRSGRECNGTNGKCQWEKYQFCNFFCIANNIIEKQGKIMTILSGIRSLSETYDRDFPAGVSFFLQDISSRSVVIVQRIGLQRREAPGNDEKRGASYIIQKNVRLRTAA
jgi:hypothetical protein